MSTHVRSSLYNMHISLNDVENLRINGPRRKTNTIQEIQITKSQTSNVIREV